MTVERKIRAAAAYVEQGWKLFTVQEHKRPWHNCEQCPAGAHDGEACPCLFCHGHQAATAELGRVRQMLQERPGGLLALRTGAPSGVVVVDAEGTDRVKCGRTGLEVIEDYDWWGDTLKAVTSGGGLHLFYAYDPAWGKITSRNRVLHNVDIKGDGGYVVLAPADGRRWLNWSPRNGVPDTPQEDLVAWLLSAKGGGGTSGEAGGNSSSSSSTALKDRLVDGRVPAGERYEFLRNLVYKLRKRGVSRADAEEACAAWYERFEQPPVAEHLLPWQQVLYELDRVWARVEPEVLDPRLKKWAQKLDKPSS
jgi:hypothetical protein